MIPRFLSAPVPPVVAHPAWPDGRRVIGWQICAAMSPSGPWRRVNAGRLEVDATEALMVGNFGDNETHARITFVRDGGSFEGGTVPGGIAKLAPDGEVTTVAPGSRRPGRIVR